MLCMNPRGTVLAVILINQNSDLPLFMIKISRYGRLLSRFHYLMMGIFLTACATKEVPTNTLADWDKDPVEVISPSTRDAASQQKSNRVAYEDFIKNEDVDEKLRLAAISRLSKMEMNR